MSSVMNRRLAIAAVCAAAACILSSCSSDSGDTAATNSSSMAPSTAETNGRGAIEVALGEPVTITGSDGAPVLTITGTRLDSTGCAGDHPEVAHTKFVATIQTGDVETEQWLWPSDIYYVNDANKVAQNREVEEATDTAFACDGSVEFIDVPPNSTMDGSPTLSVPVMTTAIGYHLDTAGVDQRVEWKLPAGWRQKIAPASTSEAPAATTEQPAPEPTNPAPETTAPDTAAPDSGGIPPGWDKNGDGMIDTDAPIGDDCETPECLMGEGE
ncbi:lipoprotein [Gordonia phage CheeseTouch]